MKPKWLWGFIPALALIWLPNVSRPGAQVEGCFEDCAHIEGRSDGSLQVVSLNMLHGFPKFAYLPQRLDLIAAEINALGADIALLQEVPWTWKTGRAAKLLAEKTGMNYASLRANGNRWTIFFEEGEAILSRFPLENIDFTELKPRTGFFEHRVALAATALAPHSEVDLVVTHLTNGDRKVNAGQAQALLDFVSRRRAAHVIMAGDFNASPDSPQIQALSQAWQDAYLAAASPANKMTCCIADLNQPPGEPFSKRIDYLFIVGDGTVLRLERVFDQPTETATGWLWSSDHAGLFLEVSFDEDD